MKGCTFSAEYSFKNLPAAMLVWTDGPATTATLWISSCHYRAEKCPTRIWTKHPVGIFFQTVLCLYTEGRVVVIFTLELRNMRAANVNAVIVFLYNINTVLTCGRMFNVIDWRSQVGVRFLHVHFNTVLTWIETNNCLKEGNPHISTITNSRMVSSNVKLMWFIWSQQAKNMGNSWCGC